MHAKSPIVVLTRISVLLVTALCTTTRPARGQAGSYTFQTLDVPGASVTSVSGINNSGQVAGTYCQASTCHGFVLTQGQFAFVDAPNANSSGTFLSGISNSGVIIGSYIGTLDDKTHGFSGDQFADIVFPSTNGARLNTFAQGINTAGQVVGFYQSDRYPFPLHGFVLTGGSFAAINEPAATINTLANGINDAGQIVGGYGDSSGSHGFLFSGGTFTAIDFPGGAFSNAAGINNAGVIVGGWSDSGGHAHGFVLARGTFTSLDFPGAIATTAFGINDAGDIVGSYTDANGQGHGFITSAIALVDPVPDLLNGSSVIAPNTQTGAQLLATKGTVVQGVAADGVAEVVVRIMAANVGDQFTLTLVNDQNSQIIPDEDGALGNPGDTSFSQGQITVTAVNTGTGSNGPNPPFAFAIYRAPVDFARQVSTGLYKSGVCGSVTGSDDQLACRSVSLQVQGPSGNPTLVPITVVRPPVILIHGLWGNPSNWDSFSPLYSDSGGADSRFYVGLINYDTPPVVTIVSSVPDYSSLPVGQGLAVLANAHGNALGFQYNAPDVLSKLVRQIQKFKTGANPSGIAVAGVQADIVAHSMGGDISRTLALQTGALSLQANFLDAKTFGQGSIHKLITVDTPHLGSTLATQLLQGQNACVRNKLALAGMASFESVGVITSLGPAAIGLPGAVGDLVDSPLSQALTNISINNSGQRTVRTALIGGAENGANLAGLANTSSLGFVLHTACGTFGSSQLAANLTPTGWPTVFGQDNDAIVGQASQFNNLAPDPGALFASDGNGRGFVHSPGTEQLGFLGPSVLDPGAIPNQVITLLNVPVTSNLVFHDLNP